MNRTVCEARMIIQGAGLVFATDPPNATDDQTIEATKPPPGTAAQPQDTVTPTVPSPTGIPGPDATGRKVGEGREIIQGGGLRPATEPPNATDDQTVEAT